MLARQMGLVMPLHDRDDVGGAETAGAEEIIHRIAGLIQFQRIDLLPDPTVGIGGAVVADVACTRKG